MAQDYASFDVMVTLYPRDVPALPASVVHNFTHLHDELSQNNGRISVDSFDVLVGGMITKSMNRDTLCSSSRAVYGSRTFASRSSI